jgi:hypothetical protein
MDILTIISAAFLHRPNDHPPWLPLAAAASVSRTELTPPASSSLRRLRGYAPDIVYG